MIVLNDMDARSIRFVTYYVTKRADQRLGGVGADSGFSAPGFPSRRFPSCLLAMPARIEITSLPVCQGPNSDSGPKRMMLAQGEFTLLHPACPEVRFLSFLTFEPGIRRGNHYHPGKTEFFYLLRGGVLLKVRDRETGGIAKHTLKPGDLLRISANVEHVYQAIEYSEVIEFSATPWSASDSVKVDLA
ncbi:MAG: cupin domain-containing protein [Opitutaceae bacterium]|jgi:mannose-6-phosphate isomerase-like protein (cupin superfamily)